MAKAEKCNVRPTSVEASEGYLHRVFTENRKTELSLCTYVLGPHRFEFRGNDDVDAICR
jgi:hypothetical protein